MHLCLTFAQEPSSTFIRLGTVTYIHFVSSSGVLFIYVVSKALVYITSYIVLFKSTQLFKDLDNLVSISKLS